MLLYSLKIPKCHHGIKHSHDKQAALKTIVLSFPLHLKWIENHNERMTSMGTMSTKEIFKRVSFKMGGPWSIKIHVIHSYKNVLGQQAESLFPYFESVNNYTRRIFFQMHKRHHFNFRQCRKCVKFISFRDSSKHAI